MKLRKELEDIRSLIFLKKSKRSDIFSAGCYEVKDMLKLNKDIKDLEKNEEEIIIKIQDEN